MTERIEVKKKKEKDKDLKKERSGGIRKKRRKIKKKKEKGYIPSTKGTKKARTVKNSPDETKGGA